jgi:DNA-binding PadR family transcriptional regulator
MQGNPKQTTLTELEGAILSEIHHRGPQTAFKVRRSFALSPSLEWRGSAGAAYAAIKRLERAGYVLGTEIGDKRASRLLNLTAEGTEALFIWANDINRAISVGIDPFRIRSGIWRGLDRDAEAETLSRLRDAIVNHIALLEGYSHNDDIIERTSLGLSIRLQRARLEWIDATEKLRTKS